jgi:ubiquinone/menaquinone biosynthesis C-methylase UbiE
VARDRFEHAELIRGYFDDRMADYDAFYEPPSEFWRWFNHTFRKAVYLRRDEVLALADRFDCQDVLDVGCGSGRNTVWWAHHGIAALHGVDVSREMIDEARAVAARAGVSEQCTFELADFEEWSSDRKWDLVAACGVFDYVIDAEAFLRHMARFANKVIYGSFPGWTLVRSPLRKIRYRLRGCPIHFYRRSEIRRIFNAVGFGPCAIRPISSGYLAWAAKA